MLATTWDPFRDIINSHHDFSRMWETSSSSKVFKPAVNIEEDEDAYILSVELPGLSSDDVDIEIDGGVLTLRGDKTYSDNSGDRNLHVVERRYGSFVRRFSLPETINDEVIDANMSHGVLTLKLPKVEAPKPKKITVS